MKWWLAHAGLRDLVYALVFALLAVIGPKLEPGARTLWTILPLCLAVALTCSGILLLFQSPATRTLALVVHLPILLICLVSALLGALCLITIIFAGTAIVLGVPAVLLGVNSAGTVAQILARRSSSGHSEVGVMEVVGKPFFAKPTPRPPNSA
jgi:hypothetical protein